MTGGVLFHVQHLLGIGHLQRSLRIAEARAQREITAAAEMPMPCCPRLCLSRWNLMP